MLCLLLVGLYVVHAGERSKPATPPAKTAVPDTVAASKVPVPARGLYFGAYNHAGKEGRQASMVKLEERVGRKFDIDHQFYRWDTQFPTRADEWTVQEGRIPLWNWSSRRLDDTQVPWPDIADGKQDATIDALARKVREFGHPVFLAFQHEPGGQVGTAPGKSGTSEDYRRAWRHIVQRFRAQQVNNVSWTWILTAFAFSKGNPDSLYPGDDIIDWIAADGYNSYDCFGTGQHWRWFPEIYSDFYAWGRKHGKPLMAAEFGSVEDPARPGRKGDWFRRIPATLQQWPEFKAMVYFNAAPACQNWVTTSESALAGFRDFAHDAYVVLGKRST